MTQEPYQTKSVLLILAGMFAVGGGAHWVTRLPPPQTSPPKKQTSPVLPPAVVTEVDYEQWLADPRWPGFRGPSRSSRQPSADFATDWDVKPPELLWKISVGRGWSSFAVAGDLLFTQQVQDQMESVVCYKADTGREVWSRTIDASFTDSNGESGSRATPSINGDGVFAVVASGKLTRLDARSGELVWQQDLQQIAERTPPMFGFCSSPLVRDDVVIVHAGGTGTKGIIACDSETGQVVWTLPAGDHSYGSPQPCTIAGERLVAMSTNAGVHVLNPRTGVMRLDYQWEHEDHRSLQPQVVDGDSILVPCESGTRLVRVVSEQDNWVTQQRWTSRNLKPVFNDFVVHKGYAYGFDDVIFTCIDLQSGEATWKRGRYGNGQVLLLESMDLLLVLTDQGDVVLLHANPDAHQEVSRISAIAGRTLNHPVVVGDRLFVRNAQEAACYRLPQ